MESVEITIRGLLGDSFSAQESDPVDFSVLEEIKEATGDYSLVEELVTLFIEDTPARLDAIRSAVASRDSKAISSTAHSLKGSSAYLGARHLTSTCLEMEQRGRSGQLGDIDQLLAQIETEYERAMVVYKRIQDGLR